MQQKSLEQLSQVAEIQRDGPAVHQAMSRVERLERWAQLLERKPHRRLNVIWQTEYQPPNERSVLRCDNSALAVAFEDPVFRAGGLVDDTFEAAKKFFSLSDRELHEIVCSCRFGHYVASRDAAAAVRRTLTPSSGPGIFGRLMQFLGF